MSSLSVQKLLKELIEQGAVLSYPSSGLLLHSLIADFRLDDKSQKLLLLQPFPKVKQPIDVIRYEGISIRPGSEILLTTKDGLVFIRRLSDVGYANTLISASILWNDHISDRDSRRRFQKFSKHLFKRYDAGSPKSSRTLV